ncbi:MAG: hypothetical protein E7F01_01715 [Veillonella sp.]|nr:hypothetical protein [Veillonella sp.]
MARRESLVDGLASCGTLACSSCGGRSEACCWGSGVSHVCVVAWCGDAASAVWWVWC